MPDTDQSVSFEDGLRRCLGRIELYDRIARRFLDTRAGDAASARSALAAGELAPLRKLSHDLTSTAGTLGAEALSAAAQALQAAVDDGTGAAGLAPLVEALAAEHALAVRALQSYVRGEVDLVAIVAANGK